MTIISTAPESEATGLVAEQYAADVRAQGYVASHTAVMAVNPEAVAAFETLVRAITARMDLRRYELVTLAAARGTRSPHCRLAHGRKTLAAGVLDADALTAVAGDYAGSGILTPAEVAMMRFAERVGGDDSASMTDDDARVLREQGFDDREIVDIALAAAVRSYYGKALQALAVPVDVPPTLSPAVRDALVEGL
jgi:alkylhydroperoxidase family enzyme